MSKLLLSIRARFIWYSLHPQLSKEISAMKYSINLFLTILKLAVVVVGLVLTLIMATLIKQVVLSPDYQKLAPQIMSKKRKNSLIQLNIRN